MSFSMDSITDSFRRGGIKTTGALVELRHKLSAVHGSNPQRHALAMLWIDQVEEGLERLAGLGHSLTVNEIGVPAALQYPKMLVHPIEAPFERLVESQAEEDSARAVGWRGAGEQVPVMAPGPAAAPVPGGLTEAVAALNTGTV